MSEDKRVSRDFREPAKSDPPGAERWADYLDWVREDIIRVVMSLPREEQRTSRLPSGWAPIELLSHVFHMEQRWLVWGFLGESVDQPWGDWNVPEPWTDDDSGETIAGARWVVSAGTTAEDIALQLRALGWRTRAVLRNHRMDTVGTPGGRFGDNPPTLEWICFHVLAEYARHAGQLDVAAEIARNESIAPTS